MDPNNLHLYLDQTFVKLWFLRTDYSFLQFISFGSMISPTIYARRSLSYLMSDMPEEALNDAIEAQVISPVWHIASYLQAAALFSLGKENEAQLALKEGSVLESRKNGRS